MKQVAIISGKGGTGKTTFSALVHSIEGGVIADCDVDAPNLHIILRPKILEKEEFFATEKAFITEKCISCGLCYELCRFNAISFENGKYSVDESRCEGCALCYNACPENAIEMKFVKTGEIYVSKTAYGSMVHARLEPGEENSGRLVSEVRKKAEKIAKNSEYLIIDSPPGVGCPVIASLTGINFAIVISEPTLSGLSDLKRAVALTDHFSIKSCVVVNRYNLNTKIALEIREWCRENGIEFAGFVTFDEKLIEQMSSLNFPFYGEAAKSMSEIWNAVKEIF